MVDGSAIVLLGDVTGKGVDAAAMTALVRHTAKAAARFDGRPSAVLHVVDEILRGQPFSLVTRACARRRPARRSSSPAAGIRCRC